MKGLIRSYQVQAEVLLSLSRKPNMQAQDQCLLNFNDSTTSCLENQCSRLLPAIKEKKKKGSKNMIAYAMQKGYIILNETSVLVKYTHMYILGHDVKGIFYFELPSKVGKPCTGLLETEVLRSPWE